MKNLRKYARQTNVRLIIGGLILLFIVGDGLILLIYGPSAAWMGLVCILTGMTPVLVTWIVILVMDWITKRVDRD